MNDDQDRPVGYGSPPVKHQFKKGQVANPKGRGKNSKTKSGVDRALERTVKLTVDGRTTRAPVEEALMAQLTERALRGDLAATREFFRILAARRGSAGAGVPEPGEPQEAPTFPSVNFSHFDGNALVAFGVCVLVNGQYKLRAGHTEAALAGLPAGHFAGKDLRKLKMSLEDPSILDRYVPPED